MKFLILFLCFLAFSSITALLWVLEIPLAIIPTVILAFGMFWLATKLCKMADSAKNAVPKREQPSEFIRHQNRSESTPTKAAKHQCAQNQMRAQDLTITTKHDQNPELVEAHGIDADVPKITYHKFTWVAIAAAFLMALLVMLIGESNGSYAPSYNPSMNNAISQLETKYPYVSYPTYTYATFNPELYPPIEFQEIQLIKSPGRVRRNETASIRIKGEPNTKFSITVIYPSGESTAQGLTDKWSDDDGYVSWYWKIGGGTSFGRHRAVITDGMNTITVYFSVVR